LKRLLLLIAVLAISSAKIPKSHATSYPYGELIDMDGIAVIISPTGTDIPLDATIQVEMWRGSFAQVGNLNLTPADPVLMREETVVVASPLVTFYLSELLQPETNYTVTLPIRDKIVTWNFTTGNFTVGNSIPTPFPTLLIIAVTVTVVAVVVVGLLVYFKKAKNQSISSSIVSDNN
jgi:hypothetical protein